MMKNPSRRCAACRETHPDRIQGQHSEVGLFGVAMGLRDRDRSEIIKVVERAAGFELPKIRD